MYVRSTKAALYFVFVTVAMTNCIGAQNTTPLWHAPVVVNKGPDAASTLADIKFPVKAPLIPYVPSQQAAWKPDGVHEVTSIAEALVKDPHQKYSNPHEISWGSGTYQSGKHNVIKLVYKTLSPYFVQPKGASGPQTRYRETLWLMPEKGETDVFKTPTYQPYLLAETPPYYLPASVQKIPDSAGLNVEFRPKHAELSIKYRGKNYVMLLPQWKP